MFKYKNGDALRDIVTGFRGYVVARQDSLTNCNRYCLQATDASVENKSKLPDAAWIDESTLQVDTTRTRIVLDIGAGEPPG